MHGLSAVLRASAMALVFLLSAVSVSAEEAAPVGPAPQTIVEISISGNKAVEDGAILERMHTRVGQKLDRKRLSRDVRRLYATGFFKDIRVTGVVRADGRHLTVEVVENPVIASLEFEGLNEVPEKDLRRRLKLKAGHILNAPEINRAITTIRKGYLKKGFYQIDVQPVKKMRKDGRVDLTLKIHEGEITRIKRIRFIGNHAFSDRQLAKVMASSDEGFTAWFRDRDVFDRQRLGADSELILQHYMNNGYLDAQVESTLLALSPDKRWFYITHTISEGAQYQVSSIKLQGDLVPDRKSLEGLLELHAGDTYSLEKLRNSVNALTTRVGDEGYAFATVTPLFERHPDEKRVDITLDIEKGREVYVERIEITGNTKTEDQVLRREMRQMEGARFSSSKLETSKDRLKRLGFFEDVRVTMPRGSSPDKVVLKTDVDEKSTGSWRFGVGFSQLQKVFVRSSISQNNFLGRGYATSLSGEVGAKTQNIDASITDPYFMGENISATLRGSRHQTRLQSLTSFNQDNYSLGVSFGIPITEHLTYAVSYDYTSTKIFDIPAGSSLFIRSQAGTQTTGELGNSLSWDTRDSVLTPRSGTLISGDFSLAGLGGTNRFVELGAQARSYIDLGGGFTLNPSAVVNYIHGYSGRTVPIYRRLSLGGIGTVRGFDSAGITIRDPATNDILGGNKSVQAGVNLFFPFPYMQTSGFRGLVFADAGDVEDFGKPFKTRNLRVSTGFGIEWVSPIGPIGLSWGFVVKDRPNDVRKKFEFAIGTTF